MSEDRSLDQERAQYAWQCVGANPSSDYVNLAKAAPALIMGNGLMQTLAFYEGKGGCHHRRLCDHLIGWIARRGILACTDSFDGVMDALHQANAPTYLRATDEALETLRWIRQYAAARKKAKSPSADAGS